MNSPIYKNRCPFLVWPRRLCLVPGITPGVGNVRGELGVFIIIGLLLLLSLPADSQAQWYVSQEGHLLDANPRIGSMGINPNAQLDALIPRINLLITGNIRGGGRFQGFVPYQNVGEFTSTLGSSVLSNFRRDSVGVADLSAGIVAPQPYLDQSRSLTGFRSGRVVQTHQAFQPARPVAVGVGPQTTNYNNRGLALTPWDRSAFTTRAGSFGLRGLLGLSYPPMAPGAAGMTQNLSDPRYQLSTQKPANLASPTLRPLPPDDPRIQPQTETTEKQASEGNLLPQVSRSALLSDYQSQLQRLESYRVNFPTRTWNPWLEQYFSAATGAEEKPALSQQNLTGESVAAYRGSMATQASAGGGLSGFIPAAGAPPTKTVPALAVGGSPEDYLRQGEQLMRQGKYYRAAEAFEKAVIYQSAGPAGRMSRAHALWAAGEFVSAAAGLNQALIQEPKLLENKIDLPALIGDPDKFARRLDELKRLSNQSPNPAILFLQGYVLYRTGDLERAQNALNQAGDARGAIGAIDHLLNAIKNLKDIDQIK